MGVHNLWELLAPVGRRVSVETLSGKKLAIDASIWMIQFMKAMRDEKGEMVRNAHLIGFFRRICKLLFLRTKPVFVFDGGTPALKRRTVVARRRQRENAQAKIRKTAEKLLLNHLKAMKLKELAEEIENQKQNSDYKGKKVLLDQTDVADNNPERDDMISRNQNLKNIDEMLAASLAAEEEGNLITNASTSAAGIPSEEDDDYDEDEEMILPTMHGKVDPAVLAALPPSMQLDLLVQMREKLMAENRQKYQKVKKAPEKFSALQIQSYLKTVAFRREIDEVRKSASGRGVGGVQTSRIASEANREFIFSSSFTGDKEALTSAGVERNADKQVQQPTGNPSSGSLGSFASTSKSSATTGMVSDEPRSVLDDDVETYLDERGRVRVSRVRAMGIRMTRDLQRNLDMMKEIDQERTTANKVPNADAISNPDILVVPKSSPKLPKISHEGSDDNNSLRTRNEQSTSDKGTSIEISFDNNIEHKCLDDDDDIFAQLVAGNSVVTSFNTDSRKQSSDFASDSDWEEGIIEEKVDSHAIDSKEENKPSNVEDSINDESEVEWEEGFCDSINIAFPCPVDYEKAVSRGSLEEEANFQEAIRRSLQDLRGEKSMDASSRNENDKNRGEMVPIGIKVGVLKENHTEESDTAEPSLPLENISQQSGPFCELVAGAEKLDSMGATNIAQTIDACSSQLTSSEPIISSDLEARIDKPCGTFPGFHLDLLKQNANGSGNLNREMPCTESITPIERKEANLSHSSDVLENNSRISVSLSGDNINRSGTVLVDAHKNDSETEPTSCSSETIVNAVHLECSSMKEPTIEIDVDAKLVEEKNHDKFSVERDQSMDNYAIKDNKKVQAEVTKASLEEEILMLDQECMDLGEEQKKHERNAESVSSEMFAECQELLQMFGLPYIIAPMEAEAQCAYMELENLVDGVVTDDSDVLLFGARSVYKNIFDDRKYVETYFMKDIENELGLNREKLVRMALLLGSDYTEGVSGIGIVNAIEVVNAFPEEDGLQKFREWIESPDPSILGKFGSSLRKRGSKVNGNSKSNIDGASASDQNVSQVDENGQLVDDIKQIFMDKHRNVSKNWHIPSTFPSDAVISAYISPQVDKSTEPFSWGKPDLFVLRKLCWEKFGWANKKADELLQPVLKEYNKHETQLRMEAFYTFNERFAKVRSKRINKAVKGITANQSSELVDDTVGEKSKSRKKRKVSPMEPESEELINGKENGVTENENHSPPKQQPKKRKTRGKTVPSEVENSEPSNVRGRGRGRGRGIPISLATESSLSDGIGSSGNEQEVSAEKLKEFYEVRRSNRSRKAVNYSVDDFETNEAGNSLNKDEEIAVEEEPSQSPGILGEVYEHKSGDPDYLEAGGGFCMEEDDELVQVSARKNEDPDSRFEFSKEYHKMGGGFCMEEEDETNKGPVELAGPSHCSVSMDEIHPVGSDYSPKRASPSNEVLNTKDESAPTTARPFSAMPLLRRKRRKS